MHLIYAPTHTRSLSPVYWSPAPAATNHHSFKYHSISDTHRPVYGSLPWTVTRLLNATNLYVLTFWSPDISPVLLQRIFHVNPSCSWTPQHQQTCKNSDCQYPAKLSRTGYSIHTHLPLLSTISHPLPFNKTAYCLLTCCVVTRMWQKTGPLPTLLMEVATRIIALACRDLPFVEYSREFCGLAAATALDDATILSLFCHGANSHRPVDLPDTTGLRWREGILRCLECTLPRTRTSPPSSASLPSPPAVGMASPPVVRMASLPVAAHPRPVPVPRQRPPVPAPRQHPPVPAPRQRPPVPAPRQRPPVPAPPKHYAVSTLPERPQESALPERPKSPRFQSTPKRRISPIFFFWGGYIAMACVAGPRAKATESPDPLWLPESLDPPWPPELHAPPWAPVSPDPPWLPDPPWPPRLPDPPWPPESPDPPWPPESPDLPWVLERAPPWRPSVTCCLLVPGGLQSAPPPHWMLYGAGTHLSEGGRIVRDPSLSQPPPSSQSPAPTHTRSLSPVYWSPAPAATNHHSFKYHSLSDTHRPVCGSLPWTVTRLLNATNLYVLTFWSPDVSPVLLQRISHVNPSCSWTPQHQQTCKDSDCQYPAKLSRTGYSIHTHLPLLSTISHPLPFNKPAYCLLTYCVLPRMWQYVCVLCIFIMYI